MHSSLRRIRGAIGMGLTWAAACGAVGSIPRWIFGFKPDIPIPLLLSAFGFLAGVTFTGLLSLTQRGRTVDQLSVGRFAGWGALGGLLLAALFAAAVSLRFGDLLVIAPTFALASAACAAGSLAIAKRSDDKQLPPP